MLKRCPKYEIIQLNLFLFFNLIHYFNDFTLIPIFIVIDNIKILKEIIIAIFTKIKYPTQ
ncbi:hypothetical protein SAMN04488111_0128 [Lutibacter flavus]|uniref:Uncharacterized protein n=1 Tax=Lutibacter flavus TaxID=691689 RepID=A0A238V9E5_9FLAO|nr:hypothetical protein SAMN04488111_0128 [Lutibacter flavus]